MVKPPGAAGTSPRRRFDRFFVCLLVAADAVACLLAVTIAALLHVELAPFFTADPVYPTPLYTTTLPVVIFTWIVVFAIMGMYEVRRLIAPVAEALVELQAVTVGTLMLAALSFLSGVDYSRWMLVEFWICAVILTFLGRSALGRYRRGAFASGRASSRTLIIGVGDLARLVSERLGTYPFGFDPVGFVNHGTDRVEGSVLPVLGNLAELPHLIEIHDIDEVLVADPDIASGELMEAIRQCETLGVEFLVIAGPLQILTANAELSGPGDLPVFTLGNRTLTPLETALKRAMDLVFSVVLLILLAPLMALVALVIRRQIGSSALFRQERIGLHGRPFTMYKFRTMRPDTDAYAPSPSDREDERITPVGRRLRASSLDELPQLFNVIKGEMSLVGPRPEMAFIVEKYEPWQRRRLDAKPGMTGLWQILGRKDLPLRENLEYDFYYIKNQSLALDLVILFRTIPVVLFGRGAY